RLPDPLRRKRAWERIALLCAGREKGSAETDQWRGGERVWQCDLARWNRGGQSGCRSANRSLLASGRAASISSGVVDRRDPYPLERRRAFALSVQARRRTNPSVSISTSDRPTGDRKGDSAFGRRDGGDECARHAGWEVICSQLHSRHRRSLPRRGALTASL